MVSRQSAADPEAAVDCSLFFRPLPSRARRELARRLEPIRVEAGADVVREGEDGDRYYLVADGTLDVLVGAGPARLPAVIAQLGPGDGFGEMALLLGGPRRATVRARTPALLYGLDGADFSAAVHRHRGLLVATEAAMTLHAVEASLGASSPFSGMPVEQLHWLAARTHIVSEPAGAAIFRERETGDAMYVVRSGEVAIVTAAGRELALLKAGDAFGEQALLAEQPRSASAIARTDCELLRLDRDDFLQVLHAFPDRADYFARLVLQRQRPRRVDGWEMERQEAHGEPFYVLKHGARYLRLSEECAFLWDQMDGERTVRDLAVAYFHRFGGLGVDVVLSAMVLLQSAGFLEFTRVDAEAFGATASPSTRAPRRRWQVPMVRYFSLGDVDAGVTRLHGALRPALSVPAQVVMIAVALVGGVLFARMLLTRGTLPSGVALGGAVAVLVAGVTVHAAVHETAHALACKHFGREVHRAGAGWYFFMPAFFVDTSDSWLAGRLQRMAVAAAGPYSNFVLSGLAMVAVLAAPAPATRLALFQFAALGYVLGVAQLNPLLEFDGYYILMDWLDMPNLRPKALAFIGKLLARAAPAGVPARTARLFGLYGLLSLAYTLFIAYSVFSGYENYVASLLGRLMPALAAAALGWIVSGLLALSILRHAWADLHGAEA